MSEEKENYTPLKVANMAALIERWGYDCLPNQACREFTHNAIQAIVLRMKNSDLKEGQLVWTQTPWIDGVPKLCLVDTGEGMTGAEMVKYINQLSISGTGRGPSNFGIGAKITGLSRSPMGLAYVSFKDGVGETVLLKRTYDGNYGLLKNRDGSVVSPVKSDVMPDLIRNAGGTGTMVILLGDSLQHNTRTLFGAETCAIVQYLNERYYTFPKGVTVKAETNDETKYFLKVNGTKFFLDRASIAKGELVMSTAKAHWWVLAGPDDNLKKPVDDGVEGKITKMKSFSKYYRNRGHTAYLFEDELYEYAYGPASYARVQRCGIALNSGRVVIYFEPTDSRVSANSARSKLQIKQTNGSGVGLEWDAFAEEFKSNMPQELRDVMAGLDTEFSNKNRHESVSNRLREVVRCFRAIKPVKATFQLDKGRKIVDTSRKLGEQSFSKTGHGPGSNPEPSDKTRPGPGWPRPDKKGSQTRNIFAKTNDGDTGASTLVEDTDNVKEPDVRWVSRVPEYHVKGDAPREEEQLEDRAAEYDPTSNLLRVNRDFKVYQSWIALYEMQYPSTVQARQVIQDILDPWWEQNLKECVMLSAVNGHLTGWETNPSAETLTAVVLSRYNMRVTLNREVRSKLGPPEKNIDEVSTMDAHVTKSSRAQVSATPESPLV